MHSKQTVRYLCERYPSGNCYFFKQEIITYDSWDQPESLFWGRRRPITKNTFLHRQRQGYKCEFVQMKIPPAMIFPFPQK